jgi:hypothetical protein
MENKRKPILFKVTEPSSIPYRTHRRPSGLPTVATRDTLAPPRDRDLGRVWPGQLRCLGQGVRVGGPGMPPFWRTRDWNSARWPWRELVSFVFQLNTHTKSCRYYTERFGLFFLSEECPQSLQSADLLISEDSLLFQESPPSANACFTSYKQMLRSYAVDLATLPAWHSQNLHKVYINWVYNALYI